MRLVRVELRRIFSRKVVWLALVAAAAIVAMALFGVHQQAVWAEESRAQAQQSLEETMQWWEENAQEEFENCQVQEDEARRESGDARIDFMCEQSLRQPQLSDFLMEVPPMVDQYRQLLGTLVHPFLFLALAVGSTHVAAEYAHRTLGSWLTFVPRRGPVFASKVGAAALAALPMVAVALALVLIGVPVVFRLHGIDDGLTSEHWVSIGWMALRVVGLAMVAGAFGAALAFLLRHSAAVIGLMVGYLFLAEGVVRSLLPQLTPWLLGVNIDAVTQHGTTWEEWPLNCDGIEVPCEPTLHQVSFGHGVTVLLVMLAVVVLLALLRFRTSDVD